MRRPGASVVDDAPARRLDLPATHFAFDPPSLRARGRLGGLARPRRNGRPVDQPLQPRQSIGAILVKAAVRCALMMTTPSAVIRRSLCASRRALTVSGSVEPRTSKRRCTAFETLLTFCPPAPCARTAVSSTSSGAMRRLTAPGQQWPARVAARAAGRRDGSSALFRPDRRQQDSRARFHGEDRRRSARGSSPRCRRRADSS